MPKTLLLADDSITIQKVIGITFANEDFALTTVDNGVDAIQMAKRIKPDLILADVVMPGKNGYEVCEYVKHDPELRGTPVLLLAGTFESFDEAEMARVGADGHITKPFESQTLIDKVHELTSRAGTPVGRPSAHQAAPPQPARPMPGGASRPAAPAARAPAPPRPAPRSQVSAAPEEGGAEPLDLEDFSPFEEVAAGEGAAPEPGFDAQNGAGDEDVWDLSDFEPGDGSSAEQAEALFAEAEAAVEGTEAGGIEGERTFDFGASESTDDPFAEDGALEPASEEEGFGAAAEAFAEDPGAEAAAESDDAMELSELEEVGELESEADPLAVEPEAAFEAMSADAAEGWQVEPVAEVRPAARAGLKAAPAAMGVLASRVKAAAEGLAGELSAAGATLPPEQVEAIVTRVAREVIESVAWEVVPDLCEAMIAAEIRRITGK